jgi:tetratricopeptide (TPR) repeat protein
MTVNPRIAALLRMVERNPTDPRPRFGLALEYEKDESWEDVVLQLRQYLELAEDQGNAWGRLGGALRHLGREEEARAAYRTGIAAARKHGHPSMAGELEGELNGEGAEDG